MKRLIGLVGTIALLAAVNASAQVTSSAGYTHVSVDSVDIGFVQGTVGVRFPVGGAGNMVIIPEFRAGIGVNSDTDAGVKFELDHLYGATVRLQFEADEGFYGYLFPSYSRFRVKASAAGISATESDNEFGFGGGIGFRMTDTMGIELGYERIDDADLINVSLRFGF